MSFIYVSQGFTIYPHRHLIVKGSESLQVRPKTFALLLMLLEKPREVISKRELLERIWDDVAVEEQVLVQSIREIRQLFNCADVIQTYPRKGYAWTADVQKQSETEPEQIAQLSLVQSQSASPLLPTETPIKKARFFQWRPLYVLPLIAAIFIPIILYVVFSSHSMDAPKTGVVIVLPVKNQIPGNDHDWVTLGAMDQLIHLLVNDEHVQVMSSEYVFQTMRNAKLERNYDEQQVAHIFDVSGATLIVESQLSGMVDNYRLAYKLRFKHDLKRGVIFDKDLSQVMYKLGQVIVTQTGQKLQDADTNAQSAFTSELMARALEKIDQQDFESAQSLLINFKQLEPKNLICRQYLIFAYIRAQNFAKAKEELDGTIELAKAEHSLELGKIYTLQAMSQLQQGAIDNALIALDLADTAAASSNDFLYQGGIAELRGHIQLDRGQIDLAQGSYEKAMFFNSAIRCPIGMSDNHLKLAKIFIKQGKPDLALKHFNDAKHLIETNQFDYLLPELEAVKLTLN